MADAPVQVTWYGQIKALFNQVDIDHMLKVTHGDINLGSYPSVKTNGNKIYQQVSAGNMPPGNPWPQQQVQLFQLWMQQGYPEGMPPPPPTN